ncbi:AraC family transcriptional regulator [Hyella patelloides LEGE 07179]|uniref:AraC family transcriptional regulator n=1 Tax=Hyella patelloides LEGE 07179 TaxID=945734 RepID=A0A563W4M9_9CYAN|nr:helix-turn-helix domain-containing protein [Hyella patelloides]VEP18616.1 AraC family transcriptional regulator [Hyella patelloides LEGE 07179]
MKNPEQIVKLLDYKQEKASNNFVPQPATLSSKGRWDNIHFELHQQPKFETLEHQHTMHVIAYGVSNSPGERWLDGRIQKEKRNRGDIAIIPAGITHRCNWNNSAEFGILAVEPALLQQVGQDLVDGDRIELIPQFMNTPDALIQGIFSTLRDELESPKIGSNLLVDNLKITLAIHLLRKYCATKPKLSSYEDGLSKLKLRQVTEYINEHLDRDLKIIELAAIAQISPYHFIRLFRNSTGKTPHQYILQQRIEKAKYILQHSELSISEIAAIVGFCDQSHFTKYFKRITGFTPRKYIAKSQ